MNALSPSADRTQNLDIPQYQHKRRGINRWGVNLWPVNCDHQGARPKTPNDRPLSDTVRDPITTESNLLACYKCSPLCNDLKLLLLMLLWRLSCNEKSFNVFHFFNENLAPRRREVTLRWSTSKRARRGHLMYVRGQVAKRSTSLLLIYSRLHTKRRNMMTWLPSPPWGTLTPSQGGDFTRKAESCARYLLHHEWVIQSGGFLQTLQLFRVH